MITIKEKIQNMSTEELVEFFYNLGISCPMCIYSIDRSECDFINCREGMEKYLNSTERDILFKTISTAIKRIYKKYPTGGALHIVLDDGNLNDDDIQWCLKNTIEKIEAPLDKRLFKACAKNLLKLTIEERKRLL